jgi:exonuclease SbcC
MIELVKVELKNFRSFGSAIFTPLGIGQGLTAINGPNGMGKSSIVHAIVWAMYGVTPDGVRVGALRRQGSEGDGDVEVKVTFVHAGQTVEVTRALRGKNDTTIASIELDGVEQTNVSSRTASQWITQFLGLDAEAFLTAFVVRQKELDNLVKARPGERRKIIERLAGIERMSKGLEIARAQAREAQRTVDSLPPAGDPGEIKQSLEEGNTSLVAKESELEEAKANVAKAEERRTALNESIVKERESVKQRRETKHAIDLLDARMEDLSSQIDGLYSKSKNQGDASLIRSELAELLDKKADVEQELVNVQAVNESLANSAQALDEAKKQEDFWAARISKTRTSINEMSENVAQLSELNSEEIKSQLEAELDTALGQKGALEGEIERLNKALNALTQHKHNDDSAVCPTCEQSLSDPKILIDSLETSLDTATKQLRTASEKLEELSSAVNEARDASQKVANEKSRLSDLKRTLTEEEEQFSTASQAKQNREKEMSTAQDKLNEQRGLEDISEDLKSIEDKISTLRKNLDDMEAANAAAEELEDLLAIKQQREQERTELMSKINSFGDEEASLEELEIEMSDAVEQVHSYQSQVQQCSFEVKSLTDSIAQLEAELSQAESQLSVREAATQDLEIKTAAAQSLADFRTDRLARLTPELSEVATDFVARMTEGKYTSVILDDEFTPVLTDRDGQERPVAWLSGGEESAVALALRVAIGEVLAGQRGGLLILDEVLTAQDPSRRQATMNAIKALPRQIVTINHVSEATDMVDLVANIVATDDYGSAIEEWAPDSLIGSIDSLDTAEN